MKDKRLDALLATLPKMECRYYREDQGEVCKEMKDEWGIYVHVDCQGDIRKCERE